MKVLVCIKQVVDAHDTVSLDEATGRLTFAPKSVFRMNRADEHALEEALLLKERLGDDVEIHAVTVGPPRAASVVRRALEMGATGCVHVTVGDDGQPDPSTTARALAACVSRGGFDLVLAGVMAEDDMACVTGQLVGAYLGWPCATSVVAIETLSPGGKVRVTSEIEHGYRALREIALPAVLTVQTGINQPRYPRLSDVLRARTMSPETIPLDELVPHQRIGNAPKVAKPASSRQGIVLKGTSLEKARALVDLLREKALIP